MPSTKVPDCLSQDYTKVDTLYTQTQPENAENVAKFAKRNRYSAIISSYIKVGCDRRNAGTGIRPA